MTGVESFIDTDIISHTIVDMQPFFVTKSHKTVEKYHF